MPQSKHVDWQEVSIIQDAVREQDALDALKWLAGEFQRQGQVECAVVLDRAFQDCLQIYVNRQIAQLERKLLGQAELPLN
jgi:hypothetical protein